MKIFICLGVLFVFVVNSSRAEDDMAKFQDFKIKYQKSYRNQAEETKRFAIFKNTLKSIEEHNKLYEKGQKSWKKGVTKFADVANEELKSKLTTPNFGDHIARKGKKLDLPLEIPDSIDWRDEGYVTPIKDQGDCGSSYSFAHVATIEAAYKRKSGQLVSLSEQQLVDCGWTFSGCAYVNGREVMPYMQTYGLQSEESYPYVGEYGECKYNESAVVTKVDTFHNFFDDPDYMKRLVGNVGPALTFLDTIDIKDYTSGVFNISAADCGSMPNGERQYVTVIGYNNDEAGNMYWIVKNSWGTDWGEDGYFKVSVVYNYSCGLYYDEIIPEIK